MKRNQAPSGGEGRHESDENGPVDVVTSGGGKSWAPLVAILVLMPAISYAMMEYWMFPRLDDRIAAIVNGETPQRESGRKQTGMAHSHTFDDIIVNISGTLGTRYLKTSFTIHGDEPGMEETIRAMHSRILDAVLGTLASLRLQDLEQPGARNFVRSELIDSINSTAGRQFVQELYFVDFIVQ